MVFARKVWKLLVAIKDGLALLFLLLFFALLYAVMSLRPMPGRVADGALLLDLNGSVVEEASDADPLNMLLASQAPTSEFQARDIERALQLAAKDKRIKAVVIDMSRFTGGGRVHLREIAQAMDAVRKAGKPVLTFANAYADDSYQLAAHASEVWVDPMGGAFVTGPGGSVMFYKGLFDRFKVQAHVFRAGTYKSAVEPYIRTGFSKEARSNYDDLLASIWTNWKADVQKARPKARIAAVTDDPAGWARAVRGNFAQGSVDYGLVDKVGDKTEFDRRIERIVGKDDGGKDDSGKSDAVPYRHTGLDAWLAANSPSEKGAAIGVVTVAGDIVDGDAGPGSAGGDRIAALLDKAMDQDLKALVVRVDSPGGSAMAGERIRRAIARYKQKGIPVVVSMGNLGASAGYWITTPAERVFAEPDTMTGSIGVFAIVTSFEKTLADFGITTESLRSTPVAGQPDVFAGLTPEVSAMVQASIENTYGHFVSLVAQARKRTPQEIDAIGQGRVWTGSEAKANGLVDELGGLDAALAYAAKRAGLADGAWHAKFLQTEPDKLAALLGDAGLRGRARADLPANGASGYDYPALATARQRELLGSAAVQLDRLFSASGAQAYCMDCPVSTGARSGSVQHPATLSGWRMLASLFD